MKAKAPLRLTPTETRLLALLRAALSGGPTETAAFAGMSAEEWQACHRLAVAQGVMALAWDGVEALPAALQPPRPQKLAWALAVEKYEARYHRYCRTVAELSAFYAARGITAVQLKGVGLSTYYPVPSRREGGDIDIFTCSADPARMTDREANRLAETLMEEQGADVDRAHTPKHSLFYYKGLPIENHHTFLNTDIYPLAVPMDSLLRELMRPVPVEPGGEGRVLIPSPDFNTLFLAFHAVQHYPDGLALHHLCDWACLLRRHGLRIPEGVTDRRFRRWMAALTRLCNRYLGTDVPVEGGEQMAEDALREMLRPSFTVQVPARTPWGIVAYKTRRLCHRHRLNSAVTGLSLARRVTNSVVAHLCRPQTIFLRGEKK